MSTKICVSLTRETHEILKRYAEDLGISKTEYVKKALLDKLEERKK